MKVSLKWLKDYVDITVSPTELANRLTMAGNEVKAVETVGAGWQNIIIGQLTAINPHPNADRLRLATVDLGTEQRTVVCGAPNLKIGDKVVFASVGAEVIDGHSGQKTRLKAAKIRGVESAGMICSEMELGISQKHEGDSGTCRKLPPSEPISRTILATALSIWTSPPIVRTAFQLLASPGRQRP